MDKITNNLWNIRKRTFNNSNPFIFGNYEGWDSLVLYIDPNGGTLTFEGASYESNYTTHKVLYNDLFISTSTATGSYSVPMTNIYYFRVSSSSSNNATILGTASLQNNVECHVTNAKLMSINTAGDIVDISVQDNALKTYISYPVTHAGSVLTDNYNPTIQLNFAYDLFRDQLLVAENSNGGSYSLANSALVLTTTAAANSTSVVRSRKRLHPRVGQGVDVLIDATFDTPTASTTQYAGIGNGNHAIAVGYNGTEFSIMYASQGKYEVRELTVTGASSASENATITLDGTGFTVPLTNAGADANFTAYEIGKFSYSTHYAQVNGNKVIFTAKENGAKVGAYTFSSGTATATFATTTTGQSWTQTWVAQSSFSEDVLDGTGISQYTIDPSILNLYKIHYHWGSGQLEYSLKRSDNNEYVVFHRTTFSLTDRPNFIIPSMSLEWVLESSGTAMTMYGVSAASFNEGIVNNQTGSYYSFTNTVTGLLASTEVNILAITMKDIIGGLYNQSSVELLDLTIGNDTNKNANLRIYLNPTTLGDGTTSDYPDFQNTSNVSAVFVDTNSITHTGGSLLRNIIIAKNVGFEYNLSKLGLELEHSDILLFTIESAGTGEAAISVNWNEIY